MAPAQKSSKAKDLPPKKGAVVKGGGSREPGERLSANANLTLVRVTG